MDNNNDHDNDSEQSETILEFSPADSKVGHFCTLCYDGHTYCHEIFASAISIDDYDDLMYFGWYRRDMMIVKDINELSCCPTYEIRNKIADFSPSKSQRKVLRKFRNYIFGDNDKSKSGCALVEDKSEILSFFDFGGQNDEISGGGLEHTFSTKLVRVDSDEFDECENVEFELFRKYQVEQHRNDWDSISMEFFRQVTCDNPFVGPEMDNGIPRGLWHIQYYIDEKLVAVGILEIHRTIIVSSYFIYDPDYKFLNLGTLGALYELGLAKRWQKMDPKIQYYHLGHYVHNCHKMRYKSYYRPCQLLCPFTFQWVDYDENLIRLLDSVNGGYTRLKTEDKFDSEHRIEDDHDQDDALTSEKSKTEAKWVGESGFSVNEVVEKLPAGTLYLEEV